MGTFKRKKKKDKTHMATAPRNIKSIEGERIHTNAKYLGTYILKDPKLRVMDRIH